ncbi:BrnT family toxin [Endozoicomonas euniceicola]|uniref:BrnT family toxin n=1 Tax=Endozoicomonas euniceicola TaxID=1234143 RepID=UPI00384C886C
MGNTQFEYDEAKSLTTKDESIRPWQDSKLVCLQSKVKTDEIRLLFIGQIQLKHWTAIATRRGEKIRIISVRRSRKNEVALYES